MFERFRKSKDESGGSEMVEKKDDEGQKEFSYESKSEYNPSIDEGQTTKTTEEATPSSEVSLSSEIGIGGLMDKRVKLGEAIDYVGLMIKNLKEKRTELEKDIEDESVDIKNLKEKLMKVNEYIEEENQGIQILTKKRTAVENEADEVGSLINNLRNKLEGIDKVVEEEGNRIKNFKSTREKPQNL